MKVAYATTYDAHNVKNWSGLGYFIAKALEQQSVSLSYLNDLYEPPPLHLKYLPAFYKLLGKKIELAREPYYANLYARKIEKQLSKDIDVLFSPSSLPIARVECKQPKVLYTDACFGGMLGFYSSFNNLSNRTIGYGHQMEQESLNSCALAIYASDWAADTAKKYYGLPANKLAVVPFGANISAPLSYEEVLALLPNKSATHLSLLFIGVDWERKGGEQALAVTSLLNKWGIPTTLHVVGIKNFDNKEVPDFVKNYGFISKATEEGRTQLKKLFTESHFLIVPSQAEAYGLVFCEANAYALPSIATKVGGITTIIKDDINGKTFHLNDSTAAYAEYLQQIFLNTSQYQELCKSSYNEFITRLNWNSAGKQIKKLVQELL